MNAASLRQEVLANNIANVNTPGFKASAVDFSGVLAKALGQSGDLTLLTNDPRQIGGREDVTQVEPDVVTDNSTSQRADGNNVDMDAQMSEMAANTVYFETAAEALDDKFSIYNYIITAK